MLETNFHLSPKPRVREIEFTIPLLMHIFWTPGWRNLRQKVRFLSSIGLSYEESVRVCARFPALFGYSVDNNLRLKFEYLVAAIKRSVDELKVLPQYLVFSLEKRIIPRHLHLKKRNVMISLQRMLLWSDGRFYAKWKWDGSRSLPIFPLKTHVLMFSYNKDDKYLEMSTKSKLKPNITCTHAHTHTHRFVKEIDLCFLFVLH